MPPPARLALRPLTGGEVVSWPATGGFRLTGSWLGTSIADKSLVANYGVAESVALVAEYGVDVIRGTHFGFYPAQAPAEARASRRNRSRALVSSD